MSCFRARERWTWNGNADSSLVPSSYLKERSVREEKGSARGRSDPTYLKPS